MKILVTGGAGFIGSHIADALLQQGMEVVVVDNLSTGCRQNMSPSVTFYSVSIIDKRLRQVFKRERPDFVIHHAAQTVVTRSVQDPIFDARTNVLGSLNILDNCVNFNVKKIVYASSCAIYGSPHYIPIDEGHPLNPISPYGVSKQVVEKYLHVYHTVYGLDYCALRYSNVFGPRQNPAGEAGVVAIFTRQMLSGQQPKIFGDGNKTRSYVYVDDIVQANIRALRSGSCGIYNIGTAKETSDQLIFDLIREYVAYNGTARYVEERPGEIGRMCLDCTRAAAELGWRPLTTLEDGLAATVRSYGDSRGGSQYVSAGAGALLAGASA